jgi:hypothetical protein
MFIHCRFIVAVNGADGIGAVAGKGTGIGESPVTGGGACVKILAYLFYDQIQVLHNVL